MAASDAFYNNLLGTVDTLIIRFGKTFNIRKRGGYDPATRTVGGSVSRTTEGVVIDAMAMREINNLDGWHAEKTLILRASSAMDSEDEVEVDGRWFPAEKMMPIKPADVTMLYMVDVSL